MGAPDYTPPDLRIRGWQGISSAPLCPCPGPLWNGVRELRLTLGSIDARLAHWIAPDRRIIFLTWFRKTRQHEEKRIARAVLARKQCEAEHGPADADFHRSGIEGGTPWATTPS